MDILFAILLILMLAGCAAAASAEECTTGEAKMDAIEEFVFEEHRRAAWLDMSIFVLEAPDRYQVYAYPNPEDEFHKCEGELRVNETCEVEGGTKVPRVNRAQGAIDYELGE